MTNKIELNFEDGLRYAQWGLMRMYVGANCSYDKWQQTRNPKVEQNAFWLEKLGENERISPVFGFVKKES